ncbi:endolytic transglycosylase MltG [Candidatus Cloacimonadota bacterium]
MKTLFYILLLVILIFIIQAVTLFFKPIQLDEVFVQIENGDSAIKIAQKLADQGVITSKAWFYIYVKLTGVSHELSFGKYMFYGDYKLTDVVNKIRAGEIYLKRITIPEGLTVKKTCRRLSRNGFGDYDSLKALANDSTFARKLTGFAIPSLEGFLYPETYHFPEDITEEEVLSNMVRRFFIQTAELDFEPREEMDFYEIIVMASIVEKEAHYDDEKPKIASVYLNRIEYKMKLQADPTIAYILEQMGRSRKKLYYKDLTISSPYNTYINTGLPPTPICSPALNSIRSVLYPLETDYFFFFANSKSRRHIFSQTYSQHLSKQRELKKENGR